MQSKLNIAIIIALSVVSLSCVTVPVKRFYTLVNDHGPLLKVAASPVCKKTVVLASVEVASSYKGDKIVFRTDGFEIKYFNYRLWVSSPEEMIESLLARKMEKAKVFAAVENFIHSASDHLTLYAKLNVLEEIDNKKGWNARLGMSFVLKSDKDEDIIWEYEFDESSKMKKGEIIELIDVMNEIYNKETNKMLVSLAQFLSSYKGCEEAPVEEDKPPFTAKRPRKS